MSARRTCPHCSSSPARRGRGTHGKCAAPGSPSAYVSIRQHTSVYVSIHPHTSDEEEERTEDAPHQALLTALLAAINRGLVSAASGCRRGARSCRRVLVVAGKCIVVAGKCLAYSLRIRNMCRIAYVNTVSGERTYASHTQHVPHRIRNMCRTSLSLYLFSCLCLCRCAFCLSACLSSVSLSLSISHIHTHKHTQIYQAVSIYTSIVFIIYNLYLYLGKTRNTVAVCPLYCPSTTLTTSLEPIVCCSESRATAACVCVCVCVSIRQHTSAYVSIREAICLWRSSCAAARQQAESGAAPQVSVFVLLYQ